MKRPIFIFVIFVFLLSVLVSCESSNQKYPNVLFILVDDLGWKDLGVYGSEFYDTPNLDALAKQGIRFTDAYSAHPVCSVARTTVINRIYAPRSATHHHRPIELVDMPHCYHPVLLFDLKVNPEEQFCYTRERPEIVEKMVERLGKGNILIKSGKR